MSKRWLCVAFDPGGTTGIAAIVYEASQMVNTPKTEAVAEALKLGGDIDDVVFYGQKVLFAKAGAIPCQVELVGTANCVRAVKVLMKRYKVRPKNVRVAVESFVARPGNQGRNAKKEFNAPLRVTAGLLYGLAVECGLDVEKVVASQTPSNAKGVVDNDRLRRWGFWGERGSGQTPHERDAIRHLLLLLRRINMGQQA